MINKNERMSRRLFNAAPDQSVKSSLSSRGAVRGASKSVAKTATEGNLFWNSIWLLDIAANALFVIGAALLLWSAMLIVQRLPILPIKTLVVSAPVAHVSSAQLEQVVRTTIKGGFLTVNLAEAQHAFEQLPWVRRANLRRQWPDRLVLTLEGQRAVAQWTPLDGEMRLVNDLGEVFAIDVPIRVALPVFAGPEGTSAEILVRYGEFAAHLAEVNQDLVGVRLSSREAWQLTLVDGVVIELGREQAKASLAERVARFVTYYPRVKNELQAERSVEVVDMRYPNGFAMKARKS